jgi:hypothetical protein
MKMRETHCGFTMSQILKKFPEWKIEKTHYLVDGIWARITDAEGESYNVTIKPHDEVKQILTSRQTIS